MTQNWFKSFTLLEKPLFLKKKNYKNRNTNTFHEFTIKNDFGNIIESDELRFESTLKGVLKSKLDSLLFDIFSKAFLILNI